MASQTIILSIAISFAVLLQCGVAQNQEQMADAIKAAADTVQNAIENGADIITDTGFKGAAEEVGEMLNRIKNQISNAIEAAADMGNEGFLGGADEIATQFDNAADKIAKAILNEKGEVRPEFYRSFHQVLAFLESNLIKNLILVSIILLLYNFQEKMTTSYPINIQPKRFIAGWAFQSVHFIQRIIVARWFAVNFEQANSGRCWKEWVDGGRFQRHDGSGLPMATEDKDDKLIVRLVIAALDSSLSTIRRMTRTRVSTMTIHRRLIERNLRSY
ncbi:HTH_Tnp_Tc3_2 domain-containing protein [Trichonephila clavipes]|nr:HTH_Tnp_Tc3_2 domain-containing protein [Trichonephila clavipes]